MKKNFKLILLNFSISLHVLAGVDPISSEYASLIDSLIVSPKEENLFNELNDFGNNYAIIFLIAPKWRIDWSTPNSLYKSLLWGFENQGFKKSPSVGHGRLFLKCENRLLLFGVSGDRENLIGQMTRKGWGMTPMFATFNDGYVEDPEASYTDTKRLLAEKHPAFWFGLNINLEECNKIVLKMEALIHRAFNNQLNYGFQHKNAPTNKGCLESVASLIDDIPELSPLIRSWLRKIHIPKSLLGKNSKYLPKSPNYDFHFPIWLDYLSENPRWFPDDLTDHWGNESDPIISVYDVDKAIDTVERVTRREHGLLQSLDNRFRGHLYRASDYNYLEHQSIPKTHRVLLSYKEQKLRQNIQNHALLWAQFQSIEAKFLMNIPGFFIKRD